MIKRLSIYFTIFMFFSAQVAFATTITFWTTETQSERMKTIQLILDTFEALNDDIKVNLVAVDENDFPTQMVAATSAGNIPEVINMGSELAVAFGSQGLMDHDAHAAVINQIGKDQFFKGSLELTTSPEGHAYALPYHGWVQGIWYRGLYKGICL